MDGSERQVSIKGGYSHHRNRLDPVNIHDPDKINSDNFTCAELDLWFNRIKSDNDAYVENGILINSEEFLGPLNNS